MTRATVTRATVTRDSRGPAAHEYDTYYANYISKVPPGDIIHTLGAELDAALAFYGAIPEAKHHYRYAEGKWSVAEVLGHIVDTERVFAYRALRFARNDTTPLPGMDQDDFMAGADFSRRTLPSLVDEFEHLRRANIAMAETFDDAIFDRAGEASGCPFTVRALLFIMAGHEIHHRGVVGQLYL